MSSVYTRAVEDLDDDDGIEVRSAEDGTDTRQIRWTIATSARARDGHRIDLDKMDMRAFRANPVMLWGHDANDLPIGTWSDIEVVDGKRGKYRALKATANFLPAGMSPKADQVYAMARAGVLRMASIRWRTLEAIKDPEAQDDAGMLFTRTELLEASIVPIGADTLAMQGRSMTADQVAQAVELGVRRALSTPQSTGSTSDDSDDEVDPIRSLAKVLGVKID